MALPFEDRIRKIQKRISVEQNGQFDITTSRRLASILGITSVMDIDLIGLKKKIQSALGFSGKDVDGIFGNNTITSIEFYLNRRLPDLTAGSNMIVSKKALDIIIESEVSSLAAYRKIHKFPSWPQGESGITIGIGYDLGYVTKDVFERDWKKLLPSADYRKLLPLVGLKANDAKAKLTDSIKKIEIPVNAALDVFYKRSLSVFAAKTREVYPGIEFLPPDAQGAILSLIYNRGTATEGENRKEMLNLKKWIAEQKLSKIAEEIRSMKRLWPNITGLISRREREASLVENAKYFMKKDDFILV